MDLGKAIRKARGSMFTQYEIAQLTGVTNYYVSLLEHNKRDCSLAWLRKFSLAVNLSIPVIFYMAMDKEDATSDMESEYDTMKPHIDDYFEFCFGINMSDEPD